MQKWIFALILIHILNISIFAGETIHAVKKGETLYSISRMYDVSLDKILIKNKIDDSSKIKAGYKLIIPDQKSVESKEYVVSKGDTLYSIARKNNIKIESLLEENSFNKKTVIKIGQKINIPVSSTEDIPKTIEKSNKQSSIASGKKIENDKNGYYWPVNGEIKKMSGKLQGSRIFANIGDVVYSVSSGKVVWEGPYRGFGRVIFVESVSGYVYVYGGSEKTHVTVGDSVAPGSELGIIGFNVYDNTPAMFFSVYKDGQPIDVEKAPRL
ncbi:MAG: LysM peptidoglycan-binding domain-containing protein [Spirochaetia bacterium]|jgi:murein DD-endopeptidase MepM/ murein hydrolase activator NlpD|nr:LysM peptidoglycan-binding domain-containing protein [Spirochaetia bacterium]